MIRPFRSCLVALLLFSALGHSAWDHPHFVLERITHFSREFERLTDHFTSQDLVVFDLDNTVFREVQMLGTDEWYSDQIHALTQEHGVSKRQASFLLKPLALAIKSASQMKLMEDEIPALIHQLQVRQVPVLALTARNPDLINSTLSHLKRLGIDFRPHNPFPNSLTRLEFADQGDHHVWTEDGVIFADGGAKGRVLRGALERFGFVPKRLAAIDDRVEHMSSYVEALQDLGVEGRLIHYLRVLEERPYDPEIARIQQSHFVQTGQLLSDEHAEMALQIEHCTHNLHRP